MRIGVLPMPTDSVLWKPDVLVSPLVVSFN